MKEKVKEWWEEQQRKFQIDKYVKYLTDTFGKYIWNFLKINDFIKPNKIILNIGVGTGRCTKDLFDKKTIIYALDISSLALERVSKYTVRNYLSNQLGDIQKDYFDLAISHLVAQHMSDKDLLEQMKVVIKSLNPHGIFAMQFASNIVGGNDKQDIESQMMGGVCRTLENMKKLVEKAGGKMTLVTQYSFPKLNAKWYAIHIKK